MLILYNKDEKNFLSNGIGVLDKYAFDDVVAEELNGIFKLEFSYPIFAKHSAKIVADNIIRATTPDSEQPFFISKILQKDGYLRVTAYHIFYKLIWELIEDINIVGLNGQAALDRILEGTQYTGLSDISKTASIRIVRYNVVEAIMNKGKDNTFISRFGGEIKRDNFRVEVRNHVGRYYDQYPNEIRYAKNLVSYEADIDSANVATRIMPLAFNGLLLPEKYVAKPGADPNNYKTIKVEYPDIKAVQDVQNPKEDEIPLEEAYEKMRQAVLSDFTDGRFDAKANYRIEFQDLATTEEYKNKAVLERLFLGDEVKVIHTDENLDILSRLIAYRWSPLRKEYDEIELGNHQEAFSNLKPVLEAIAVKVEQYKTDWEKNVEEITLILNSALGGYVYKRAGELLIMDTDDPATALKVWRWNLNGLGYSKVGVNGPYEIAITMDGRIMASFIYVNKLSALSADLGIVTAGMIRDKDGTSYWDLDNKEIVLNVKSLKILSKDVATKEDVDNISLLEGPQGIQGPAGADGLPSYTHIAYATNATGTAGFSITESLNKTYIGMYVDNTSSDSIDPTKYKWTLIKGADGSQGIQGPIGPNGQTSYLHIAYATNTNGTTGFSTTDSVGKTYIGQYTDFTSADSTNPALYSWTLIKGDKGDQGNQGVQGVQGPIGPNGQTLYTWVKYADDVNGTNMSDLPTGKTYIGLAYNKTTASESTVAGDYSWSLIKGADGSDGIQGPSGANGVTLYTWLKYADTPTTGMSDLPAGKTYMGIAYNKTSATESSIYADYSWSLIKGDIGPKGDTGTSVVSVAEYYLATSASSGVTTSTAGWTTTMQAMTSTNKYLWNYEEITFSDGSKAKTIPVIIGVYGNTGNTGATGRAITSIVEYYLASSSASGVTRATTGWTTTMQATTPVNKYLWNYEVVNWSVAPLITYVEPIIIGVQGDAGKSITSVDVWYYLSTSATALLGGTWSTTAPAWVNGKYMWSKVVTTYSTGSPTESTPACITGANGGIGSTGTGISSITEEYYLSTSKTAQSGGSWVTTPPAWSVGKYMWTRSKIVYSNPASTVYTTPIVDNSWEVVNDIKVGGVNHFGRKTTVSYIAGTGWLQEFFNESAPNGLVVLGTSSGGGDGTLRLGNVIDSNGDWTISFLVKSNGNVPIKLDLNDIPAEDIIPTQEYVRCERTVRVNNYSEAVYNFIDFSGLGYAYYYFDNIKIEKGNKATDWSPHPSELYTGVTKIDRYGINVSISTSDINTQLTHKGLEVRDGTTQLAVFGDSGAIIPNAQIDNLKSEKVIQKAPIVAVSIGGSAGRNYSSFAQAMSGIFGEGRKFIDGTISMFISEDLSENIYIENLIGGNLNIYIEGRMVSSGFYIGNCTTRISIIGQYTNPTIKSNQPLLVVNSPSVWIYNTNIDGDGGSWGVMVKSGGRVHIESCDFVRVDHGVIAEHDGEAIMRGCRGNVTWAYVARQGGTVKAIDGIPVASQAPANQSGIVYVNGTFPVASTYSPPAVTPTVFVGTFGHTSVYTVAHDTANVDSYYGASGAQNRWDSSMAWKDGVFTFGGDIYNYWQGGYNVLVEMRVRRKNSSHGSSGGVAPAPYNFAPSESFNAVGRGIWTEWTTVPSSVFGSGGATLKFYNGVSGASGYAIWDAAEVKVTVTKNV